MTGHSWRHAVRSCLPKKQEKKLKKYTVFGRGIYRTQSGIPSRLSQLKVSRRRLLMSMMTSCKGYVLHGVKGCTRLW
uniref:Uncharacterized protein n=1 Tax=Aegilops tauschii subsp. strangulata TaxID=200361 RepID=A0A453JXG8_AEGTS